VALKAYSAKPPQPPRRPTLIWHLLADPAARDHYLGADYYIRRIDTERRTRSHIRQLEPSATSHPRRRCLTVVTNA
jgi:hypothetical protein